MLQRKGNDMYSFKNDYSEMTHPKVFKLMREFAEEQHSGYGHDDHTKRATILIKKHFTKDVDVHLLIGGTSTNKIVISHALKPYEAVISVESGHINVHETGAIEATGHKILTTPGINGKITSKEIFDIYNYHNDEHMVKPKMVYISNSTEIGTIYNKMELTDIYNTCQELNLLLFLDGARLGVALTSEENDLTLDDIAHLTDVFYIGGTKNGALLGEAVIITNDELKDYFRYSVKTNGGLLAKGYLIGIQFEALFSDNLFFELAKHANHCAQLLKNGLARLGVGFLTSSPTNQQFVVLENSVIKTLEKKYLFEEWEQGLTKTVIRLVTSWATDEKAVIQFLEDVKAII